MNDLFHGDDRCIGKQVSNERSDGMCKRETNE